MTTASTSASWRTSSGVLVEGRVCEARKTGTCSGVGIGDGDDFGAGHAAQRGQVLLADDRPAAQQSDPDRGRQPDER